MKFTKSEKLFEEAKRVLVGGVSSPVRAFKSVGGTPVFFVKGKGSRLFDADGNSFIDYCQSWGALILGHAAKNVVSAVSAQAKKGTSFGAATPYETRLGLLLKHQFPSCEKIRFTSSGTEAVMTAVRLARGATRKAKIIKFEGCYHGHSDALLAKAGSGLATLGMPESAGVPASFTAETLVLPFNDRRVLEETFRSRTDIAGLLIEPIAGNMGMIPADPSFLELARRLTQRHNTVLIFDEVITGFRVHAHGAQALYGIRPDLTTLGKVIGGGLPVGAVGGKKEIMDLLAPEGPVYQAGTLSGNPLSMAAGIATIEALSKKGEFQKLSRRAGHFIRDLRNAFKKNGIAASIPWAGSMFTIFFCKEAPSHFREISPAHKALYVRFFNHMLRSGVYLPPSPYEAMFVSTAHTDADFKATLQAVSRFRA